MPWNIYGGRRKTEENPEIRDVWAVLRQIQNIIGGMSSEVASIALSVNRYDARIEAITVELRQAVGRIEATASALAQLATLADRPGLWDRDGRP